MDDHTQPPSTIREVGIHIGYMREDIAGVKKLLEEMPTSFITKAEAVARFTELEGTLNKVVLLVEGHQTLIDRLTGAVKLLKGAVAALVGIAAIIGALWWIKG